MRAGPRYGASSKASSASPPPSVAPTGAPCTLRKATRAEPPQQAIYDALGIGSTPGGTRKTLV